MASKAFELARAAADGTVGDGVPEAPVDDKNYGRKNEEWEEIPEAILIPNSIPVACSDETTALTAGTNKFVFRMPFGLVLSDIRISLTDAQTTGNKLIVDVNQNGSSILSTKLSIDNNEKTSLTALNLPVISNTSLLEDAEISVDIDQIAAGTTAKGLKLYLIGLQPNTGVVTVIPIGCSNEYTNITTGQKKVVFRMPYTFTLIGVRASLSTAQTGGDIFTVDIRKNDVSILSTKLTIDNNSESSVTATIPAVRNTNTLENDTEISIDVEQVGNPGAKGLKVYLLGYPT